MRQVLGSVVLIGALALNSCAYLGSERVYVGVRIANFSDDCGPQSGDTDAGRPCDIAFEEEPAELLDEDGVVIGRSGDVEYFYAIPGSWRMEIYTNSRVPDQTFRVRVPGCEEVPEFSGGGTPELKTAPSEAEADDFLQRDVELSVIDGVCQEFED